jgi:ABC-type phosphate transport system substrate-binding protein
MRKLIIVILVLIPVFLSVSWKDNTSLVVIVNSGNSTDKLTKSEVKLIYLRKITRRWNSINKNIIPVDRKDSPEIRKDFLNTVLGMSEDELERYFTEQTYKYEDLPPLQLTSDAEVIDFVSKNIGAIGYVNVNSISIDNSAIKVIYP